MADSLDINQIFRRAVEANVKFYQGWLDLSLSYFRGLSEVFLASDAAASGAGAATDTNVLVLEGEAGTRVGTTFVVTNDLERKVSCRLVAPPFKDLDGRTVRPKVSFRPPALELQPGKQQTVQAEVLIDRRMAEGRAYQGRFALRGMEGFSVPVVLRRRHRIPDAEVEPAPPAAEAAPQAPPRAATRGATVKTRARAVPRRRMAKQKK